MLASTWKEGASTSNVRCGLPRDTCRMFATTTPHEQSKTGASVSVCDTGSKYLGRAALRERRQNTALLLLLRRRRNVPSQHRHHPLYTKGLVEDGWFPCRRPTSTTQTMRGRPMATNTRHLIVHGTAYTNVEPNTTVQKSPIPPDATYYIHLGFRVFQPCRQYTDTGCNRLHRP